MQNNVEHIVSLWATCEGMPTLFSEVVVCHFCRQLRWTYRVSPLHSQGATCGKRNGYIVEVFRIFGHRGITVRHTCIIDAVL